MTDEWVWSDDVALVTPASRAGETYALGPLAQLIAIADEIDARPGRVSVLGCTTCRTVCTFVALCDCCAAHRHDRKVVTGNHPAIIAASRFLANVESLRPRRTRRDTLRTFSVFAGGKA